MSNDGSHDKLDNVHIRVASTDTHPFILTIDNEGHVSMVSHLPVDYVPGMLRKLADDFEADHS